MNPKNIKKSKLKNSIQKKLLFSAAIAITILCPFKLISQPLLTKSKFDDVNKYFDKSFITKAIEKTGSSVVTIETQRYVNKRKFRSNSQLFLDPYFERFFGLDRKSTRLNSSH